MSLEKEVPENAMPTEDTPTEDMPTGDIPTGDMGNNTHPVPGNTPAVLDHKAERALVWKFDSRLLPVLAVMYLFNALDKANLGNAQTAGLDASLGLAANQYNIVLSVFFVPYVLTAPLLGILGKKFGPSRVLPLMMFSFGCLTLLTAAVRNFAGLMAVRWFLGMSESAFFPLVIYYQTMFYRRGELARRLALFYAASNVAYAFGGLLAFGVFQVRGGVLANWRYLFLVEGSCSVLFSAFAFWHLPRSAAEARFLTSAQKRLAYHRIAVDSSAVVDEPFVLRESLAIFREPTSWLILAIEACLGVPLQSVALFLPQIIARLDYGPVKTNLYTVAPNVSGAAVLLVLAFASDYTRLRFPFVAAGFIFTFLGFVLYTASASADPQIAYFASFLMTWGTSAPSVLLDVLYNNNIANEGRRVVLTSVGVPLANAMGLVSSNIFRSQDAPQYTPALVTTAVCGGTGLVLTLALGAYMVLDNRRRDRRQGGVVVKAQDIPTAKLHNGPSSPDFRWFL